MKEIRFGRRRKKEQTNRRRVRLLSLGQPNGGLNIFPFPAQKKKNTNKSTRSRPVCAADKSRFRRSMRASARARHGGMEQTPLIVFVIEHCIIHGSDRLRFRARKICIARAAGHFGPRANGRTDTRVALCVRCSQGRSDPSCRSCVRLYALFFSVSLLFDGIQQHQQQQSNTKPGKRATMHTRTEPADRFSALS